MREMLSSKSFKKLVCVLVVLLIIMGISTFSDTSIVSSFLSPFTTGLQQVSAAAAKEASKPSYDTLAKENRELTDEVNELRTQLVDYYDVKEENARLWKYYDLKQDYPSYELLPASVIRRDPASDYYAFTVNKGSSDGVAVGDPVVTDKGLVGWISQVDLSTSRVKTILSPDAKVGSIDSATRDTGIVSGTVSYADKNLTTMQKVPSQNTMQKGDIVITTGVSGMYPASLIIGEVVELKLDEYDTSTYAVIKPYDNIKNLMDVVVITAFDGQGELSEDQVEDATLPSAAIATESVSTAPTTTAAPEE